MTIDWEKIREEYVVGQCGYRALAEKHGISLHALEKAGRRGKWVDARKERARAQGAPEGRAGPERGGEEEKKKLAALREAVDNLAESINCILGDRERFKRYIVDESPDGEDVEKEFAKLDTRTIRDLTSTLKDLVPITRNLYDLPTTQERSAMHIARERLQVYKQKAEADETDDEGAGVIEIAAVLPDEDDGHE